MLKNGRIGPFGQFNMVTIMRGVDLVALKTLRDMQQQQRFCRTLITLNANVRHARRKAFSQMQEHVRLHWRGQGLTIVVNLNVKTAAFGAIAK
ncbi:hypothetical protein D3C86_1846210 [compost metagenome]